MKAHFKILMTSLIFSLLAYQAKAEGGLFVEPMVTYEKGDSSIDYPSPFNNSTGSVNGLGIGARIGAHASDTVFLAADVRYSKPQFKDSSNDFDSTATSYNYGPAVGVQMPVVGLRLLGSYVLGGQLDPEESKGFDLKFTDARGPRFGVGFQVVAVSLNLEYQDLEYGKTTVEKAGPFSGSSDDIKLRDKSYVMSVSFPINL